VFVSQLAVFMRRGGVFLGLLMLAELMVMLRLVMMMRGGVMVRGRGVMMFSGRMFR
jgi:hypothetical protein